MELPHSPYLLFMGVGEYSVVKDSYKGKEVNYYVEKEYEKVARKIFGLTPEMMKFYSEKVTGIEYPWVKYSQIVGRDYVSGAMENTTATLHQESAQQNARELVDGNSWEIVIAHELFHQWFGDLVTCASWSNLTVNEIFANYSETLWDEYHNGADAGADQNYSDMLGYLQSNNASKDLVRYYYADKEDMFDAVSYNKGGRILHMLRHIVGDDAFFKSLNLYLTTNKFGNGSATKLKLAFEAVTGKDLNWYWNQWYFGSGHPRVEINYAYDAPTQTASVFIKQVQTGDKIFKLPIDIDIYNGFEKKRHSVWMNDKADTFTFKVPSKPDLINVDGDKILLWEKKDNKNTAEFIHQYKYAKKFVDRREAIDYCSKHKNETAAIGLLKEALGDPYYKLRNRALMQFSDTLLNTSVLPKIESMAKNDPNRTVRSFAIDALKRTHDAKYLSLYKQAVKDSSYSVAGAALDALANLDENAAIALLPELKKDARGRLKNAVETVDVLTKGDADFDEMTAKFTGIASLQEKFNYLGSYIDFLGKVNNTAHFKKGLDEVVAFRNKVAQYGVAPQINANIKEMAKKKTLQKSKVANPADIDAQLAYIDEKTKE
jgi:aminopeptidase N